jgi:hypothetical protein
MKRVAVWLEGEQEFDELAFMFFVLGANTAQDSVQFHFPDPQGVIDFSRARERLSAGQAIAPTFDLHVFITASPVGSLFWESYWPAVHLTSSKWERSFAPPSLFEYLLTSMLRAATFYFADLHSHREFTMGCQFEYMRIKAHNRVDTALGFICPDHKRDIRERVGEVYLADLETLFAFRWLGHVDEPGSLASQLRAYFGQDLSRDSGYRKRFWERAQANVDTLWFDFAKETFKALILIVTTFLLIRFGLKA